MAILLHKASASSIMCVVMMIARSGVANEDKRLQISFRVEGSNPCKVEGKQRVVRVELVVPINYFVN